MAVPSFEFLGFTLIVAILINLSIRPAWREAMMFLANICFMAFFAHSPEAFLPLATFVGCAYLLLELVRCRPNIFMWPAIMTTLLAFFWIKKYSFVPSATLLNMPYVIIGLSYITFRILHLIIDMGQGLTKERLSIVDYLNYTLSFPCIVAGPIQLYPDYKAGKFGRPDLTNIGEAVERVTVGMFKVFVVSSLVDAFHSQAMTNTIAGQATLLNDSLIIALYPIYLYFNFSGYTDVVLGAGRLIGLELPENFNHPFLATNFIDFWGRWHITLSNWLRTYVYSPLMMTVLRRFPDRGLDTTFSVFAFFLTFFLVGAWHGQTSEFLFFGVLQGGGVAINKLYQVIMAARLGRKEYRALGERWLYKVLCRGLTFTWFAFTLLWFWSDWDSLRQLWFTTGTLGALGALLSLWIVSAALLELLFRASSLLNALSGMQAVWTSPYVRTVGVAAMVFANVLTVYVLAAPPPPIVYKGF